MLKFIKIIISIFSGIILTAIVIPLFLAILLSSYTVQNFVVSKITKAATEYIGTTVSIDNVRIRLFNRVVLSGAYVEDFNGDTLFYAKKIDVGIRGYNLFTGMIRLSEANIEGAKLFISQDSTLKTNLGKVLEKLKRKGPRTKPASDFLMRVATLKVKDAHFKMRKYVVPDKPYGINFSDLDVSSLDMELQKVGIVNDSVDAFVKHISLREKSGFICDNLSVGNLKVSSHGVLLKNLVFYDKKSDIDMPYLNLTYSDWSAFQNFIHRVKISTTLDNSKVCFSTISYFAPSLRRMQSELWLKGNVEGTIDDFAGELKKVNILNTRLAMKFRISGLPDIKTTNFRLNISELNTVVSDVNNILGDISDKPVGNSTQILNKMGQLSITGEFNGLINQFRARATLRSQRGGGSFNLSMGSFGSGVRRIGGSVSLQDFGLGDFLNIKSLGATSLNANINGLIYKDSMNIKTDAVIKRMIFNDYTYTDVNIKGEIKNKFYKGIIWCADPNVDFTLNGIFDFNRAIPRYDFALDLRNADLHKLGINKRDSLSRMSCHVSADAKGTTIYDVDGELQIKDIFYRFNEDTIASKEIRIFANNNTDNNLITLSSDFADFEMRSRLNFADFIPYFKNTLSRYLPSLAMVDTDPEVTQKLESKLNPQANSIDNYYILKAKIKQPGEFASAFFSGLYIANGTDLSFIYNPAKNDFSLTLNSDLIAYNKMYLSDLSFTNRNQSDSISVFLRTSEAGFGDMYMPDFSLIGGAKDNKVNVGFGFKNINNNTSALINTSTVLTKNPETNRTEFDLRIYTSHIMVGDKLWRIASPRVSFRKGVIDIESFRVLSSGQDLSIAGRVSNSDKDTLHLSLNNFDLRPLSSLIDRYGFNVSGSTSGKADIIAVTGDRVFYSKINFNDVKINNKPVQNSYFESDWDKINQRINVSMTNEEGQNIISGGYQPKDKIYDLTADIPNVDLSYLGGVLGDVLGNIEGRAGVKAKLSGTGNKPVINGSIDVHDFAATLLFTKARYNLKDAVVELKNNNLILRGAKISDGRGGDGDLDLTLNTRYLKDMSYAIRVTPRKLLALNTTIKDNELFYGTAYASGLVTVNGDKRGVVIDVKAQSENNSSVFLPMTSSASISEADFIVFKKPEKVAIDSTHLTPRQILNSMKNEQVAKKRSSIDINLLLDIRDNTEIEMNPIPSHTINGNGEGLIRLRIKPDENILTMTGQYTINRGKYDFTLPSLPVRKVFDIVQGSTIQWTGNPLDARLNIKAIYEVRTSLGPLKDEKNSAQSRNNVLVNCELMLTESLLQPNISFDVNVPNADLETQSLLRNTMNTQEAVSTQFLSLLILNSFYVDNNSNGVGTALGLSTGIEYLSNQLGGLVSSDKMKLNLGYRPKSDVSSDEFQIYYSQNIISNKVFVELEANYNLGNNQVNATRTDNALTGDFYLTYVFDPKGNFRTRLFSRTIDRFDENQGLQENGVGLYYRRDIKKSLFEVFRKKDKSAQEK